MLTKHQNPEIIPIHWPGEKGRSSVRAPDNLKPRLDEILALIQNATGKEVTRNDLILKAVSHYLTFLEESNSIEEFVERLERD